jgi:hypothetical protein
LENVETIHGVLIFDLKDLDLSLGFLMNTEYKFVLVQFGSLDLDLTQDSQFWFCKFWVLVWLCMDLDHLVFAVGFGCLLTQRW